MKIVLRPRCGLVVLAVSAAATAAPALAQPLRVVNWNISNYSGGRAADLQTAIFGVYEGRSMAPDIIICEEFTSQNAVDFFLAVLNSTGPADWAAAPFVNGPDSDTAFFYRTSRVELLPPYVTVVAVGGPSPNHPRNIQRYDVRPVGYSGPGATVAMYGSHMKAQESGSDDDNRRLLEAQRIVADAQSLPTGWHFLLGGDFNLQNSFEQTYVTLAGPSGPFGDPIRSPGTWNNNVNFRFIHTQDPSGSGGMDDRHDQILLSRSLLDGEGFDYIGSLTTPYSTTTWNDPNHSYRAWGNDGSSFNASLTVAGNQMVGPAIAQALKNVATTAGGHLPVFLDLRLPPRIEADAVVDFGQVPQDAVAEAVLTVANAGDVSLWTQAGLADLRYSLQAESGFEAPPGAFVEPPGGGPNLHIIAMDTSTPGPRSGLLTITSNAPDAPVLTVQLIGEVLGAGGCTADWDGDRQVNSSDISAFLSDWLLDVAGGGLGTDYDGNGSVNSSDISAFLADWLGQIGGDC